jgi:hypothetical protein
MEAELAFRSAGKKWQGAYKAVPVQMHALGTKSNRKRPKQFVRTKSFLEDLSVFCFCSNGYDNHYGKKHQNFFQKSNWPKHFGAICHSFEFSYLKITCSLGNKFGENKFLKAQSLGASHNDNGSNCHCKRFDSVLLVQTERLRNFWDICRRFEAFQSR